MSISIEQRHAPPPSRPSHFARGEKKTYWPEIDGLRTIAVISVFAFHLDAGLLRGGFVGVDIFFVISGYLITTLLLNDIEDGHFSIFRFYQRRIARIAPASFLVIAITMISGYFFYSAQDFAFLGTNGLAAAFSFINLKLLLAGNYFKISPDAQPLVHYWSLAVEEQFYILFPVLLYAITSVTRRPLTMLISCCALSFACCVAITPTAPIAAFYLLPTRAWELLVGSSLAIAKKRYSQLGQRQSSTCLAAGLIGIVLAFFFIRSDGFPGWIAGSPVAGSALILLGIGTAGGVSQRFLAHPAMVFFGKRSYSLYLWHWRYLFRSSATSSSGRSGRRANAEDSRHTHGDFADLSFRRTANAGLAQCPSTPWPSICGIRRRCNRARRSRIRDSIQLFAERRAPERRDRRGRYQSRRARLGCDYR